MNKASILSTIERKFGEESVESKIKLYAERINDSFRESLSSSFFPKLPSIQPSTQRLKQQHSSLLFSNQRKEEQLAELRSVLTTLVTINAQTSSDMDLALSARSLEITQATGPHDRINFLKSEAAEIEIETTKELVVTDQLVFVVKKTKEMNVTVTQTQIRQRILQITAFRDRVLKDAPKVRTLKAESVNDLTHSVYTLQKRREEVKQQKEKLEVSLKAQKDVTRRAVSENEELTHEFARKAITQQETATKARLIIQDIEQTFRQKKERLTTLQKQSGAVTHFTGMIAKLET